MNSTRSRLLVVLAALVAVVVLAGLTVGVLDRDDGQAPAPPPPVAVEKKDVPAPAAVAVDGADSDVEPDVVLQLDRPAREIVQDATVAPENLDLAGDLRGVDPTRPLQQEGPLATP